MGACMRACVRPCARVCVCVGGLGEQEMGAEMAERGLRMSVCVCMYESMCAILRVRAGTWKGGGKESRHSLKVSQGHFGGGEDGERTAVSKSSNSQCVTALMESSVPGWWR
jgi:hypothetical protein